MLQREFPGAEDLIRSVDAAVRAGGTAQIYVNPTLPTGVTYEAVWTAVINAFADLDDPADRGIDDRHVREVRPTHAGDGPVVHRVGVREVEHARHELAVDAEAFQIRAARRARP